MGLADEMRARRGDPDDPFDQDAALKEWGRQTKRRARAETDSHQAVYEEGLEEGRRQSEPAQPTEPTKPARPSSGGLKIGSGTATRNGAGLVLGLLAYTLGLNFIRGGMPAVTGWLGAKFINKPYSGPLPPVTTAPGGVAGGLRPPRPTNAGAGSGL